MILEERKLLSKRVKDDKKVKGFRYDPFESRSSERYPKKMESSKTQQAAVVTLTTPPPPFYVQSRKSRACMSAATETGIYMQNATRHQATVEVLV